MKYLLLLLATGALVTSCSSAKKNMDHKKSETVEAIDAKKEEVQQNMEDKVKEAVTPSAGTLMTIECNLNKDSRAISIENNGATGCVANYTKNGSTKQVAKSARSHEFCKEIANRIAGNLKNAGFSCQ